VSFVASRAQVGQHVFALRAFVYVFGFYMASINLIAVAFQYDEVHARSLMCNKYSAGLIISQEKDAR
jgi:hypothetical protein